MKLTKLTIIFILLLACAISNLAQENPYPNELEGFEFFGKGKVKGLKLGSSTKTDVSNIFGRTCEDECKYNDSWTIVVSYFSADTGLRIDGKDEIFFPKEEFYNKIWSIVLTPTKNISFSDLKFPKYFSFEIGQSEGCSSTGECEKGPKLNLYTNLEQVTYAICRKSEKDCKKNKLHSISYNISNKLESKIFDIKTK